MGDYISRDLALSFPFANGEYDHENANEHFILGCETYKGWLEQLPVADVRKNKHYKWSVHYDEDCPQDGILKCQCCGYVRFVDDDFSPLDFCPSCGAKVTV